MQNRTRNHRTIIVGAGQCGLAMAHELGKNGDDYLVLDSGPAPGSSWRKRWESLRLFTPAVHDALPGRTFPSRRGAFPSAGAVAEYLESYAAEFDVNIQTSTTVTDLEALDAGGFIVRTGTESFGADRVIVATGVHQAPRIPTFALELSDETTQLHSSEYRNPQQLPQGPVAVVGFGTSGAQIACELAPIRPVTLCGEPTAHIPDAVTRYAPGLYWWMVHRVLTRSTPAGRKIAKGFLARGAPLIGVSESELEEAGVSRAGRIEGARENTLLARGGDVVAASSVIWATGYRPDYSWIHGLEIDEAGYPFHDRGVCTRTPGLGFLGIPFQYGLTSGLIGGAGRDARYLARHLEPRGASLTAGQ